jgi:hypothetical protein
VGLVLVADGRKRRRVLAVDVDVQSDELVRAVPLAPMGIPPTQETMKNKEFR